MLVVTPPAPFVSQILGHQKRLECQTFRLMVYVIQCPVEDGVLLYHTLTCCLLWLSSDEALRMMELPELIDRWFLVPLQFDDQKLCHQVRQAAQLFLGSAKTISDYTILTTTGCNARCFYCYEKGTVPVDMSTETAGKVVRYIMTHRGEEKVKIRWFGGEPLVNVQAIDQICTALCENDIPFSSTMVSNGFLFDAETTLRARTRWKLQEVQITLDGTEKTYNRVKRYVYGDVNAFERVMENIGLLTDADIRVLVRLNVDKHNIDEMSQLVLLLHKRFGANECLKVYSRELYGKRSAEDSAALYEQRVNLENLIATCGFQNKRELQKGIKLNLCMSDNDRCVVIAPSGHLGKCEHYIDRDFFGHIDTEERDENVIRVFKERQPEIEACRSCPVYPQCIKLKVCEKNYCTLEMQKEAVRSTIESMVDEYRTFLNNQAYGPQV